MQLFRRALAPLGADKDGTIRKIEERQEGRFVVIVT